MSEPARRWIQGGPASRPGGHEIQARVRKWVEVRTGTPLHFFDHTRIWRCDAHLVVETSPYTDLDRYQLKAAFSGFNRQGWSVRVEASSRGKDCALITLTSPEGWTLPRALELGLKRGSRTPREPISKDNSMLSYFLP
ncbi:hypothetical protein Q0M94_28070 (plasmid) [Deinococcus radiomollis]|uniref:hypothetical protein n=1 Tax=Deinococcus radiomollis TaxID=468916 RepID=UPI003891F1B8